MPIAASNKIATIFIIKFNLLLISIKKYKNIDSNNNNTIERGTKVKKVYFSRKKPVLAKRSLSDFLNTPLRCIVSWQNVVFWPPRLEISAIGLS